MRYGLKVGVEKDTADEHGESRMRCLQLNIYTTSVYGLGILCFLSDSFPVVKTGTMLFNTLYVISPMHSHKPKVLLEPYTFFFFAISSGFINTKLALCGTMKMSISFPLSRKAKADTSQ